MMSMCLTILSLPPWPTLSIKRLCPDVSRVFWTSVFREGMSTAFFATSGFICLFRNSFGNENKVVFLL